MKKSAMDRSELCNRQPGKPPLQMGPRCMTCSLAWTSVKVGLGSRAFVLIDA